MSIPVRYFPQLLSARAGDQDQRDFVRQIFRDLDFRGGPPNPYNYLKEAVANALDPSTPTEGLPPRAHFCLMVDPKVGYKYSVFHNAMYDQGPDVGVLELYLHLNYARTAERATIRLTPLSKMTGTCVFNYLLEVLAIRQIDPLVLDEESRLLAGTHYANVMFDLSKPPQPQKYLHIDVSGYTDHDTVVVRELGEFENIGAAIGQLKTVLPADADHNYHIAQGATLDGKTFDRYPTAEAISVHQKLMVGMYERWPGI